MVGGQERVDPQVYEIESGHFTTIDSFEWSDAFIVNFRRGADQPWQAPSADLGGWHKDGSYFRHFLDSREQALLTVLLWSDVAPRGGGTSRLHQFLDAPVITAVVGLRRVGKSVLLRQFAASLREQRQVVYIDKESLEFDQVRSAQDLVDLVEATTQRERPRVVIVDEVQQNLRLGTRSGVAERPAAHPGGDLRL